MKRLKTLAELLNKSGFHKEASDAVKLSPVEHPDWELWNREEEAKLLESTHPEADRNKYFIDDEVKKKLMELGVTIMADSSTNGSLGSGHLGVVYSGVYNGKPVAVKIIRGSGGEYSRISNDVSNWNKISEVAKTAPEFVTKILPNVVLAYEGTIKDRYGGDQRIQVLAMERLHKIPTILAKAIDGTYERGERLSKPPDWAIEEHVHNRYPEVYNFAAYNKFSFPGERAVAREAIKLMNDPHSKKYFERYFKQYFDKFITDIPSPSADDSDDYDQYCELLALIQIFAESFIFDIFKKIPNGSDEGDPGTNWQPMGGLDNFWNAVLWLRNRKIPVGDLSAKNIMMDDAGNLKLSDLGGLYIG